MAIIRNAATCTACGVEVVSTHVHDFRMHYCKVAPEPGRKWEGDKLVPSGEETFRFAVDGGNEYLRRAGNRDSYRDTSLHSEEQPSKAD